MLPFRFYLITDRRGARADALDWLPRLAQGGLKALQVREKDLSPAALYHHAMALRQSLPHGAPLRFYLNDRADVALALGFAGVHLREDSVPLSRQPPALRERLSFGVSTHSWEGVLAAEAAGADFAVFGPVYPTASKAHAEPLGLAALERVAAGSRLPVLALGGVTPARARECLAAGAHGVAAIGAVWNAPDPLAALAEFEQALEGL
jgi:thiamine-phosphate pyrophosphorylase